MARLQFELITAERVLYRDEVDVVVAPSVEGQVAILPNHAPLLALLEPGQVMVRKGNDEIYMAVAGGFLEVLANRVRVLADAAERAEEIDVERARRAMERAQEILARHPSRQELEEAMRALRRAQVRIQVARRRRGAHPQGPPRPEEPRV